MTGPRTCPSDCGRPVCAPETQTIVIGPVAAVAGPVTPRRRSPSAPSRSAATSTADQLLERAVWGEEPSALAEMLEVEQRLDPEAISVVVAEAGVAVVCAG